MAYTKQAAEIRRKICLPMTAGPQIGYLAFCHDTENTLTVWEKNARAK